MALAGLNAGAIGAVTSIVCLAETNIGGESGESGESGEMEEEEEVESSGEGGEASPMSQCAATHALAPALTPTLVPTRRSARRSSTPDSPHLSLSTFKVSPEYHLDGITSVGNSPRPVRTAHL